MVDGEIVIATEHGLDFDALQLRLHPAASRVGSSPPRRRRRSSPSTSSREGDEDLRARPQAERRGAARARARPRRAAASTSRPCTRDRALAQDWFHRFEGAGLDGVIAKHESTTYQPGKRAMVKVKHVAHRRLRRRRASAGTRSGPGALVGSLLLGLYDEAGDAPSRRRDVVVHDGGAPPARAGARAAPRERARGPPLARVGGGRGRARRACRAGRAAGAPARTSRGSRCASSASARSSTTTCRATASGTRATSCAGARQAARGLPLRPARGHSAGRAGRDLRDGRAGLTVRLRRSARARRRRMAGRPDRAAPAPAAAPRARAPG